MPKQLLWIECIKYGFIYLLIFLSFPIIAQNKEKIIILKDKNAILNIGNQYYFLEDPSQKLTLQDILSPEYQKKFQLNPNDVFARSGSRSAFWFKITVQNASEEDAWLEVGTAFAWYLDFYAPDSLNRYGNTVEIGIMRPRENKFYDINWFWLPLNKAKDNTAKTYYFRIIENELSFEVPLKVGNFKTLTKNKDTRDFLSGGFLGIMLVMFLYNLFLYFSTRYHVYFYYLAYLFFSAPVISFLNYYFILDDITWVNQAWFFENFFLWSSPAYLFTGLFCIKYLHLNPKKLPISYWLIIAEMFMLSLLIPFLSSVLGFDAIALSELYQISLLALYLTCLITAYYLSFKKERAAKLYALGWTLLIGSVFVYMGVVNGLLPFNVFSHNAIYFGTVLEVWLFSLALGDRINILRKENLLLVQKQNEVLEKTIKERTQEILERNAELKQQQEEILAQRDFIEQKNQELNNKNEKLSLSEDILRKALQKVQRNEIELKQQQEELLTLNENLGKTNRELNQTTNQIKSSMKAAQTIQNAILPYQEKLDSLLTEYFVLYSPKDVVSGDFYWLNKIDGKLIIIAADCTGHGVPGAFMTLIGNNLLDKIVRVWGITNPAEILKNLNQEVQVVLRQKETGNNSGMDMTALQIMEKEQENQVIFAGAKQNLLYCSTQNPTVIHELKGTRKSIGGEQNEEKVFENQILTLPKGSILYFGSDGLEDQNNLKRKRFGKERLKSLLQNIASLPLQEQKIAIENALQNYMQGTEQRDDILWLGVRL